MLSFSQALAAAPKEPISLLMGNGFSQAWKSEIFNYKNLLDRAHFGESDNILKKLFTKMETYDFEKIMKELDSAKNVLDIYNTNTELSKKITIDQTNLKNSLIQSISKSHPSLPSEITNKQFTQARIFLKNFDNLFTLNYDLLMYWARNQDALPPKDYDTDDGFRAGKIWQSEDTDQNVFFLHGGLHLFDSEFCIKKHAYTNNNTTIITQVRANLEKGKFPLFVSEPTSEQKLERILHNPYLNFCYKELGKIKGSLFIFGHSLDDIDKHLFEQIQKSKITNCFISIYGDPESNTNKALKANATKFIQKQNLAIDYFNAETAPIWKELHA